MTAHNVSLCRLRQHKDVHQVRGKGRERGRIKSTKPAEESAKGVWDWIGKAAKLKTLREMCQRGRMKIRCEARQTNEYGKKKHRQQESM